MRRATSVRFGFLAGVSGAALLVSATAYAQTTETVDGQSGAEETVAASDSLGSTAPDEQAIVITGVRGSLLRSIQAKRNADTIIDAISSEELGKFPDRNVAEA